MMGRSGDRELMRKKQILIEQAKLKQIDLKFKEGSFSEDLRNCPLDIKEMHVAATSQAKGEDENDE